MQPLLVAASIYMFQEVIAREISWNICHLDTIGNIIASQSFEMVSHQWFRNEVLRKPNMTWGKKNNINQQAFTITATQPSSASRQAPCSS